MKKIFLTVFTVSLILSCISKPPVVSNEVANNEDEQLQQLLINTDVITECMALIRPLSDSPNELIDLISAFNNTHPTIEVLKITLDVSKTLYILLNKIEHIDMDIAEYTKLCSAYINGDHSILIADLIQQTEAILEKIDSLWPDIEALDKTVDTLHNAMQRYGFEFTP